MPRRSVVQPPVTAVAPFWIEIPQLARGCGPQYHLQAMSSAIEAVEFAIVQGEREGPDLALFSLSTCAFCRQAMDYLMEVGVSFRWVYLDQLDFDLKREVKKELKTRFHDLPVFPVLVIDDSEALSGFVEEKWTERLGSG
jgi:glutaredoxin-like protein NrdH